jgi:cytochrome c-type biogenesis protein CcmH/NrfF
MPGIQQALCLNSGNGINRGLLVSGSRKSFRCAAAGGCQLLPGAGLWSHSVTVTKDNSVFIQGALTLESPRKRLRLHRGFLFLMLASTAFAQTESQIESDEVKRVGSHLTCQCGCKDDVNCMMSAGQCPVCKPMRTKIFKMQQAGMDDSAIVASFVKDLGEKVFRPDPSSSFWLVPYFSLGAGGLSVVLILIRMRRRAHNGASSFASAGPRPTGPYPRSDSDLSRYLEAIEEDAIRFD